ncbi:MAG TPA: preprotein translocase subunit SecA [Actinobacteria bacterium]|mgnify:CR=1 FL=1|nr:preprotein translocase subunit SecA [Actinomycetota bacterium]
MFKLQNLLRAGQGKAIKRYDAIISRINEFEKETGRLSDYDIKGKKAQFHLRYEKGETLESIMPEAFAVAREAARRVLGMRHFDVQLLGGIVLFEGKIAEMKTGEGKTLVATLPAYLNSFTGKSCHIVTVNDYLAKRDSEWMGKVYSMLGMSVGLLQNSQEYRDKISAYLCDVVYGTNNEFGFDYLRDNMVTSKEMMVQKEHHYAIIDEVDSILIDEARTPLIISGIPYQSTELYKKMARIVPRLEEDIDFEIDEKQKSAAITEEGVLKVEKITGIKNIYDPSNYLYIHALNQALKAYHLFKKDVDYIVKDGEVLIVDEFTGRILDGRRYSEGLHQAIEAKENVRIKEENQTLATITIQNYFRMYEKLAGMTGTALTEAEEFRHIYKLETSVIPTNMPMIRDDMPDLIYKTEQTKFEAVVEDIKERYAKGQPVLVGTISIEKSELLSEMLKKEGIPHEVLNARYHEKEAEIIAKAGQPGSVTISTNMAGRGTDIILGEGVVGLGGLHVLGTERHESRRIDNQLRGRSGRQGDPGSSQFYLSLKDDLLRLFGSDRISFLMERMNFPDDMPIAHPIINRSIENAQRQVEARNFEARKHVLEYDDVMNKQREVIYERRKKALLEQDLDDSSNEMIRDIISRIFDKYLDQNTYYEEWDIDEYKNHLINLFGKDVSEGIIEKEKLASGKVSRNQLKEEILERALLLLKSREEEFGPEIMKQLKRIVILTVIDNRWRDHLLEMDYLKEGIGLRSYGQHDPLIEYKHESFHLFKDMIEEIKSDTVRLLYNARIYTGQEQEKEHEKQYRNVTASGPGDSTPSKKEPVKAEGKVGRNDPCPCGSGKKYKKCCGANL